MKIRALAPLKCMGCRIRACYDELPFCNHCIYMLYSLLDERCEKCGNNAALCTCGKAKNVKGLFFYGSFYSKKIIYAVKQAVDNREMDFYAELLIHHCGINIKNYDCVTFVPRSHRNIHRYGYDQSKVLAESISKRFGIPVVTALKRVGREEQKLLSYSQRLKNIAGKYELAFVPDKKYNRVLLVDDVTTTGATVEHCASLLRGTFANVVIPIVLAKTHDSSRAQAGQTQE